MLALCLCAFSCDGVLYKQGNDFRCSFAAGPQVRDEVCAAGDVCGTDDRCHRFVYEGPRFEGPPTLPTFTNSSVLHPTRLNAPIVALAGGAKDRIGLRALYAQTSTGDLFRLVAPGRVQKVGTLAANAGQLQAVLEDPGGNFAVVQLGSDFKAVGLDGGRELDLPDMPRFHPLAPLGLDSSLDLDAVAVSPDRKAVWRLNLGLELRPLPPHFVPPVALDAGTVFDVGYVNRPGLYQGELALGPTDFLLNLDGGALTAANAADVTFNADSHLKQTRLGEVVAVVTPKTLAPNRVASVLSTWGLTRSGGNLTVERRWNDCSPCGLIDIVNFAPVFTPQGTSVDVVCRGGALFSVTGSSATDPSQRCEQTGVEPDLDVLSLATVGTTPVQDNSVLVGFSFGGRAGQVWRGDSFSTVTPTYLDRVPIDVSAVTVGATVIDVALTNSYVAPRNAGDDFNGFVRLPITSTGVDGDPLVTPLALVHQSTWVLTREGDLRFVDVSSLVGGRSDAGLRFGPRLVDGRGAPIQRALWGEALAPLDGGEPTSMLVAADDSLYFVTSDQLRSPTPNTERLTAQLTPEPGTSIRHLALERTPLGSNGVDRMRAYVVTSRNAYEVTLGSTPPRWAAKPLLVSSGEPAEVWFDNPRGGLARIGYRTGEVFTLPGGFQLAEALQADAGVAVRVLDYENLGGWPVALATTGLYQAKWDVRADGSLANRFADGGVNRPMHWEEITLADGGRPWLKRTAKGLVVPEGTLSVRAEPQEPVVVDGGPTTFLNTYRLFVFLPDAVYEVGQHVRKNKTAAP